ncbi:hypothetical protein [Gulosibacter hominis]|uniref:hypothetical protein n=1 Tax=Gulosibacter hominis TaxID=2770504 RepID=UPI00191A776F|nr:hypothetical protein [Gulosibacter hominis]
MGEGGDLVPRGPAGNPGDDHRFTGLDLDALRTLAACPKPSHEATALPDGKVPAISYLRVSTKDLATRNGLEEGLSIPAQREAAQRKADQLNAVIVARLPPGCSCTASWPPSPSSTV